MSFEMGNYVITEFLIERTAQERYHSGLSSIDVLEDLTNSNSNKEDFMF